MRTHFVTGVVLSVLALSSPAAGQAIPAARNVEIVVNHSLYASGEITDSLNQYLLDVAVQGYLPTLTTTAFANATELRSHLANRHATDGLAGAVFIGDIPRANYEIATHTSWPYESFPIDLYFQDLDGTWADGDADGRYDDHTGDVAPEIWLGRMVTHNLTSLHAGRTEAGMLNDYFAKNHAYRRGNLSTSTDALAYIDDDWVSQSTSWASSMQTGVSGDVTLVNDKATTDAADYESRLANDSYEHVMVAVHSNAVYHAFEGGGGGTTSNSELEGLDPEVLFYNLWACSNARYTTNGYMAGEYVFGTDYGLLSVGSTKTGSMISFYQYFSPLGRGYTFGEAWKQWWEYQASGGFNSSEKDWSYGMTMIGDPLLATQAYQDFLVWADFDQDGDADADDIEALRLHIRAGDLRYDVDGDGYCLMSDLELMISDLVEWSSPAGQGVGTAMGDFNLDGQVDTTDLTRLAAHYGTQGTWAEGNANYDPMIDVTDLTILARYYGFDATAGADAIPEPVALLVMACGLAGLLRGRRRT